MANTLDAVIVEVVNKTARSVTLTTFAQPGKQRTGKGGCGKWLPPGHRPHRV